MFQSALQHRIPRTRLFLSTVLSDSHKNHTCIYNGDSIFSAKGSENSFGNRSYHGGTGWYEPVSVRCRRGAGFSKDIHCTPSNVLLLFKSISRGPNWQQIYGLFPLSQHFEKSNSHIANILIFTPEWSADYSLFSQVTECVMNYLSMQNFKKYFLKVNKQKVF